MSGMEWVETRRRYCDGRYEVDVTEYLKTTLGLMSELKERGERR